MIAIKKGLTIPISGSADTSKTISKECTKVGLVADDYIDMKPAFLVEVGSSILKGQKLFEDKKNPGVFFTSPCSGTVKAIHRGDKRAFQSIEIENTGDEQVEFKSFKKRSVEDLTEADIKDLLIESGLWTCLRTRPFSKTPKVTSFPQSIFVNLMDTNPLAVDPVITIANQNIEFNAGIEVLKKLTKGNIYIVSHNGYKPPIKNNDRVVFESFAGPHPAGNVGTHIHFLNPVSQKKTVWHLGAQDTAAIGKLFLTGKLNRTKTVALTGPHAKEPKLLQLPMGACLSEVLKNEFQDQSNNTRVISGSVLNGRTANANEPFDYLGRFHNQITLIEEGNFREFLGWQSPGLDKYSIKPVFLSKLLAPLKFRFTTNLNGSHRAIVPIGSFEAVMPLDILPTILYRHLLVGNWEAALPLGALELDEEDVALSTFVDPCKNDYCSALRDTLRIIERES